MHNVNRLATESFLSEPAAKWCRLFRYHLERGTGKFGTRWYVATHLEWTADEFINALSEYLGGNVTLSSATFESWKTGRTLPRGIRRVALFRVFWPQVTPANRPELEEFRNALARAAAEQKVWRTSRSEYFGKRPSMPEVHPGLLNDEEKVSAFIRLCARLSEHEYSEALERADNVGYLISLAQQDVRSEVSRRSAILRISATIDKIEKQSQLARHDPQVQSVTLPLKLLLSSIRFPLPHGSIIRDQSFSPDLVAIDAGSFEMGGDFNDPDAYDNEMPLKQVKVEPGFLLGRFPVTFAEYDLFAKSHGFPLPYDEGWGRTTRPVVHVSWEEASAYAKWLAAITGLPYRLCTEAEWEFAARAGSKSRYYWGNTWQSSHLNAGEQFAGTTSVGNFPPNAWGLYDMLGNVWEWVEDDWSSNYADAETSPKARQSNPRSILRCLRGGSWDAVRRNCRVSDRCRQGKDNRINNVGFRVARDFSSIA
jgi:formylglycine-generating enzyme required for sulfatase activity